MPSVFPRVGVAGRDSGRFEVVLVSISRLRAQERPCGRMPQGAYDVAAGSSASIRWAEANGRLEEKQKMRLTDPVADMLARIRNAIRARHQKVDIPASKLKIEIARILKEEGYIANYKPTEEEGHKVLRVYLKYGNEQRSRHLERGARVASGLPRLCSPHRDSARPRRSRHQHPDHAERRDDRTPGAPAGRGRRTTL